MTVSSFFISKRVKAENIEYISKRDGFVDNLRGLIVLLFLFSSFVSMCKKTFSLPDWINHTRIGDLVNLGTGTIGMGFLEFSLFDLGPIIFYSLIGLVLFENAKKAIPLLGKKNYSKKIFIRGAALIGVAAITSFIIIVMNEDPNVVDVYRGSVYYWNAFSSVGLTSILIIPIIFLTHKKLFPKIIVVVLIFLVYWKINLTDLFIKFRSENVEGGLAACIGYLLVLLVFGVMRDLINKGYLWYLIGSVVLVIIAAFILKLPNSPDKPIVFYPYYTCGYMIVGSAVINTFIFVCYSIDCLFLKRKPIPILATLGRNLIVFAFFTGIVSLSGMAIKKPMETIDEILIYYFILAGLYVIIGFFLERKKIVIKLY